MSIINCYYIIDAKTCLCELVSVGDTGCLNVKYLQISIKLPQYKFILQSQYFQYSALSANNLGRNNWLSKGSGNFIYVQLGVYPQIEMVVSNNAW